MNKWIVRAAIVTGILGFSGAIYVLISLLFNNPGATEQISKPDSIQQNEIVKPDTPVEKKDKPTVKPKTLVEEPIPDKIPESIVKYIEKEKPKPFKEASKPTPTPPVVDEKDDPSKRYQTVGENRTLDQEELDEIMTKLDDEIFKTKSKSNCIKLIVVKYGNNEIAVSQIEAYLRKERYVISSKETSLNNLNGVRVNATGKCIVMTIGSF